MHRPRLARESSHLTVTRRRKERLFVLQNVGLPPSILGPLVGHDGLASVDRSEVTTLVVPETRFACLGSERIAYQVYGSGPIDLVTTPGSFGSIDAEWEDPAVELFNRRSASFARTIRYDRRGSGGSDPVPIEALPPLEFYVDELIAVMDAAGSDRAVIHGLYDGGPVAMLAAATRPERVAGLILGHTAAAYLADDDYPIGFSSEQARAVAEMMGGWGTDDFAWNACPSRAADERFRRWLAKIMRSAAAPGAFRAFFEEMVRTDVRGLLPSIHVPTLVMHRTGLTIFPLAFGAYLADHIDGARLVEVPGSDLTLWGWEHADLILEAIQTFLADLEPGSLSQPNTDRVMATVLFTDIECSTERAREFGDRGWRVVLDLHEDLSRRRIEEFGGRLVKTTGDGVLATFDGPGRGILCARSLRRDLEAIGAPIRSGLHAGEIELRGADIGGVAVHIAARVMATAGAGEVLVSRTVRDLVVGSDLTFDERGPHELKGVDGVWELYALTG